MARAHKPKHSSSAVPSQPPDHECPLCPRLVSFRHKNRQELPDGHNGPVPSFGDKSAELLIVGLAPGRHGANRTGRPFTGDWAGDLLFQTLLDYGFAHGTYEERADDGLRLINCCLTNAVRCVPPENKPTSDEVNRCRPYLIHQLDSMKNLRAIVALGRIAHDSVVRALGSTPGKTAFAHGAVHRFSIPTLITPASAKAERTLMLFDSYHCSRYNTNTGVLTPKMFRAVFKNLRDALAR
jgi:uracil-DNA glycosylase family 4